MVHMELLQMATWVCGLAFAVLSVSQIALVFAYRTYYAKKYGTACRLPLFRLLGWKGETIVDNISHLEFSDRLGWTLRLWLIAYYAALLVFVLSLAAFFAGLYIR